MAIKGFMKSGESGKEYKVLIQATANDKGLLLTIQSPGSTHSFPKYVGMTKDEAKELLKQLGKLVT